MGLPQEKKNELAHRLLRGEDVEITLKSEPGELRTDPAEFTTGLASVSTTEERWDDEGLQKPVQPDTLDMRGENSMSENLQIDANVIVEALKKRIGALVSDYEAEIALRDAIIQHLQQHDHNEEADE